jgi:hypothetical protein
VVVALDDERVHSGDASLISASRDTQGGNKGSTRWCIGCQSSPSSVHGRAGRSCRWHGR